MPDKKKQIGHDFGQRRASTAPNSSARGIMIVALLISVIGGLLLFVVEPHFIFGAIILLIFITLIIKYPVAGLYTYLLFGYLRPQDLIGALVVLRPNIFILGLTVVSLIIHRKLEGKTYIKLLPNDKLFLAFLLAAILSNLTSIWLSASVETTTELLKILVFYFTAILLLTNWKQIQNYMTLYLLSLGFVSIVQIWTYLTVGLTRSTGNGGYGIIIGGTQILGGAGPLRGSSEGVNGVGGYSNYFLANASEFGLGMCIALALSFYAYKAATHNLWRMIYLLLCGMFIVSIIFCGSRGAFVGLVTLLIFIFYKQKKLLVGIALMVLIAVPAVFIVSDDYVDRISSIADYEEDESVGIRFKLWTAAVDMVIDYPVFGVGTGNFSVAYGGTYRKKGSASLYWSPHNIFIQILTEMGLVGFTVYMTFIWAIFWINHKTRILLGTDHRGRSIRYFTLGVDSALVAYIIAGQFITATYYPHLFQLSVWASALYFVAYKQYKKPDALPTENPDQISVNET